jgi:hypothetical protein
MLIIVCLIVGCSSLPDAVRNDAAVNTWLAQMTTGERDDPFHHLRILGYNEAVIYGEVSKVTADQNMPDYVMRALEFTKPQWVYRQYSESRFPVLGFGANTFTNQPLPCAGQHWAVSATANAKGIWYIHNAKRIEP